ncbi:hypothetical protein L227DRAFT_466282, partial [Lentinus tigrinus ALCF2SS1-6]
GEQEHCLVKIAYGRTNKVKHEGQIARRMLHGEKLRVIKARVDAARAVRKNRLGELAGKTAGVPMDSPPVSLIDDEKLPYTSPHDRYHIAHSQRNHSNVLNWVSSYGDDPALQDFYMNLKDHVLDRLQQRGVFAPTCLEDDGGRYTFEDRARLVIYKETAYWHEVLRLNWTSYDLRRSQDANHGDIMLLADRPDNEPDSHPFLYARVIRIFHVNIRLYESPMQEFERMDILFVCWFQLDHSAPGSFQTKRLHRLEFVPDSAEQPSFGFVDPSLVIRGCHVIPVFAYGRVHTLLGPSMAREVGGKSDKRAEAHLDFRYHY